MALPFHVEQPVAAPAADVWAFLLDFTNIASWMQGTEELVLLTPGPLAKGSRFRQTRRLHGRVATEEFAVTALDPEARRLALEADGRRGTVGRGVFRFGYEVREHPGGSVVVLDGEIAELGRAVEFVASFFVGNFVKVVAKDLEGLRHLVEQSARPPGHPERGVA